MKKNFIVLISLLICFGLSAQPDFINYEDSFKQLAAPPGATDTGLYGFYNPAMASSVLSIDSYFSLALPDLFTAEEINQWGFHMAFLNSSIGILGKSNTTGEWNTFMRAAGAFGNSSYSLGYALDWNFNQLVFPGLPQSMGVGSLIRPIPYFSWGLWANFDFLGTFQQYVSDLAIRPFGNKWLTVFGDYWLTNPTQWSDFVDENHFSYSFGGSIEIPGVDGFLLSARYFPQEQKFTVGGKYSTGFASTHLQADLTDQNKQLPFSIGWRAGGREKTFMDQSVLKNSSYLSINLFGGLSYQTGFFQQGATLLKFLKAIDDAKDNPTIAGIQLNTSGMYLTRDFYYEIHEKLLDFKKTGKKIVIYIDRADMDIYYMASCADHLVMDPMGLMSLEGYVALRTYFKGTFEKLGIGYDEYRLFKYKSAGESYSRTDMSEGEKEQWDVYLNRIYNYVKSTIMEKRGISDAEFESLVNDFTLISPQKALDSNLVDSLGRWEDIADIIEEMEGKKMKSIPAILISDDIKAYDDVWGEDPKIALVYALGVCDMDTGIQARVLKDQIKSLGENPDIKAVVIRVDSPGGDALASDLVAEEIMKIKETKPIVISQGYVAGSGGYWLSMHGDKIFTTPFTITGSIGVAGSWIYDKGLKDEWGITTDKVQVGKHADIGAPFSLPILGGILPDRNLSEEEKAARENYMRELYDDFVAKVAESRDMEKDEIHEIAQGRIWSGSDAVENGLADNIGGLEQAILWAKEQAGISESQKIDIQEYPEINPFDISFIDLMLGTQKIQTKENYYAYLSYLTKMNGLPMTIMSIEDIGASISDSADKRNYFDNPETILEK